MCNAKVGTSKHDKIAPTYKRLKKEFYFPNNVEYEFGFDLTTSNMCEWKVVYQNPKSKTQNPNSKKKYVLDLPIVPNTWPMKICTNLSRKQVLAFEDVGIQLQ